MSASQQLFLAGKTRIPHSNETTPHNAKLIIKLLVHPNQEMLKEAGWSGRPEISVLSGEALASFEETRSEVEARHLQTSQGTLSLVHPAGCLHLIGLLGPKAN
jgi:hypothetical protein